MILNNTEHSKINALQTKIKALFFLNTEKFNIAGRSCCAFSISQNGGLMTRSSGLRS